MTRLHGGAPPGPDAAALARETRSLATWVARSAPRDAGLAHDALQESVEAILLDAVLRDIELPGPRTLGVAPEEYLGGLGDAVGEVRRLILADLAAGRVPAAELRLATLEHLYQVLLRFETTRAIVSLKPKQDTARALLEKTRGEVTLARMLHRAGVGRAGVEDAP